MWGKFVFIYDVKKEGWWSYFSLGLYWERILFLGFWYGFGFIVYKFKGGYIRELLIFMKILSNGKIDT